MMAKLDAKMDQETVFGTNFDSQVDSNGGGLFRQNMAYPV